MPAHSRPGQPVVFDVVLSNPPYQDRAAHGRSRHKLWVAFTRETFGRWLADGGVLCQVSPSSFRAPGNPVLGLLRDRQTLRLRLDTASHFPQVASTFADYVVVNAPADGPTEVVHGGESRQVDLAAVWYLPDDPSPHALEIHRKVVFDTDTKLPVEHDYVTCHNSRLGASLSKVRTDEHVHPVFHTNRQTWWSSVRQPLSGEPKVMWSRSGKTMPFFDDGLLGATDMAYLVRVAGRDEGEALVANLSSALLRYVLTTARWSGFGEAKVFEALPDLPRDRSLDDDEMFARFGLTDEEARHVRRTVG
jgi:hypothetical protein